MTAVRRFYCLRLRTYTTSELYYRTSRPTSDKNDFLGLLSESIEQLLKWSVRMQVQGFQAEGSGEVQFWEQYTYAVRTTRKII